MPNRLFFVFFFLCRIFSRHTSAPLKRTMTQLLFWLIRSQKMQMQGDTWDPWNSAARLCAGVAELWRQDSRWAWLGWGPFKSNCVALGSYPGTASPSEQITCSSKGYGSPWHFSWDWANPNCCGLILNSCKCVFVCASEYFPAAPERARAFVCNKSLWNKEKQLVNQKHDAQIAH